jgi:hypothetical protein
VSDARLGKPRRQAQPKAARRSRVQANNLKPPLQSVAADGEALTGPRSAAAIKTVRSTDKMSRFVIVRGAAITPRSGSSFWSLSNGGFMVVGGGTATPIGETVTGSVSGCPGCVYVQACYCPGYDPNKDDGCRFDGPANGSAANCKQKGGLNCSCHFTDFFIMDDGSYVVVTP